EVGHVLDDGDAGGQQDAVHGARSAGDVVDVQGVDAHQRRAAVAQVNGGGLGQEGVAVEIGVRAPVGVPAGVDQHGAAGDLDGLEQLGPQRAAGPVRGADDHAGQVGDAVQADVGQILAAAQAVGGRVDVGAGVGDHVDARDGELGARVIVGVRLVKGHVVADQRRGQAAVGDLSALYDVAEVDQPGSLAVV